IYFRVIKKTYHTITSKSMITRTKELSRIFITFFIFMLTGIFFRANNIVNSIEISRQLFSKSFFEIPYIIVEDSELYLFPVLLGCLITAFFLLEWFGRK